jgi:DHA2 family methylenomycin A resistance protein-like MFS transporter
VGSPALVAICLGYFMVILDTTVVNAALPALRRDLGTGVSGLQWVVDGYTLLFASLLLSGGTLGDRFGARRMFQTGLSIFLLASAGCAAAPSTTVLILARVVQGIGAAVAVPTSLALLRAAYTDPSTRARAFGVWGGIAGLAAAPGPVIGGLLVIASWRLVFVINIPIGIAAIALTARFVPAPAPRAHRMDPAAQLVGVLAVVGLTFALIQGGHHGVSPLVGAAAVVFLVAAAAFVVIERRAAAPMLPPGLFRDRGFSGGNAVGLLLNLGFYGELFVLNLYFQHVLGYSALRAGLALLPQMGVVAAGSALSGRCTAHMGSPRPTMLFGLTTGGAGLLGLIVAGAQTPYGLLVAPLVAAGFGMSFTMPAVTTALTETAPVQQAGLASGAISGARQIGDVLGVALLGGLIGGAHFLAGALLTATIIRQRPITT